MDQAQQLELEALSRQRSMLEASARGDSEVQRFYCGRSVFLTGGSGFLGKQLIEKLLRSCDPANIFILLRPKKGNNIKQRLDTILEEPVFDSLRKQKPDFANKIIPVEGDIAEINLGLNDDDWNTLTEQVDIIFHVAAVTRFDEALSKATLINVRGTRECLKLGKACMKLRSYVHVSTAYSHTTLPALENNMKIDEVFYKSPVPSDAMILMAENMDEERLTNITQDLIKDWPNTYTFTKAISEHMVQTNSDGLPICIVRPGVVICSYNEPMPGWIDASCIYGASGLLIAGSLGLMHVALMKTEVPLGIVPCDIVNNTIIAAAKETADKQTKGGEDTKIYTVTSVNRNPLDWLPILKVFFNEGRFITTPKALYYNIATTTSNKFWFLIMSWLFHIIPAYVADFICLLMGKKRRFAKLAKKLYQLNIVFSYFVSNNFQFDDQNTEKLYKNLSKTDQSIFNCDISTVEWREFILLWIIGCRKYIVKDGLKNTAIAARNQKYFQILHYCVVTPLCLFAIWKLVSFVNSHSANSLYMLSIECSVANSLKSLLSLCM